MMYHSVLSDFDNPLERFCLFRSVGTAAPTLFSTCGDRLPWCVLVADVDK